jgi:hypothetical protein
MSKVYRSYESAKSRLSRGRLAAGAIGLAAVVGGTTFALVNVSGEEARTAVAEVAAPAPVTSESVAPSASTVPSGPVSSAGTTVVEMPSRTVTALPSTAAERKASALRAGAGDVKVQRPLIEGPQLPGEITVSERGSVREDGKMLRVVSARKDLTGYDELAWVAGAGKRVGSSRCTQEIRLSNEQKPKKRPTLLLCWRTSAERSVYTVAVNVKQKPSQRESVAAINKAWAKLR